MTEYDYSPAAYERYIAQQTRVTNWVTDTLQQSHAYSNPFVLSPTLRDRAFYDEPDDRTTIPVSSRQVHPRSKPHDQRSAGSSSRPSRSRVRSYSEQRRPDHDRELRPSPSRHRSHSHSRSSSTQRSAQIIYQPSPPHASQSYAYPQPHAVPRAPAPRIHTSPGQAIYQYPTGHRRSASRPVYVPPPPPGQKYQIYRSNQPHTMSREQLYHGSSQTRHYSSKVPPQPYFVVEGGGPRAEYKHGPPIHAPVPTKPQQPLLKRLLEAGTGEEQNDHRTRLGGLYVDEDDQARLTAESGVRVQKPSSI
ncbi:hypothetical protein BS17DRAFT_806371 [Gyrodon lividus]|nr:hypothetical protein BS17DRAFT_806371 [Gyrodon lividus]